MTVRTWKPDAMRTRGTDAIEFRLMFMASFAIFLVPVALSRLVPRRRPAQPFGGAPPSIVQEAKAAAYTAILPAFMN